MNSKGSARIKIKYRIRKKISGVSAKPRLSVFRSNSDIYAQLIDDANGVTLAAASSRQKDIAAQKAPKSEKGKLVGAAIATKALEYSCYILIEDTNVAFELLNEYAPEHLIIASDHALSLAEKVINAGSVFLGHYSPESAGDYASGTNHTLPTNGYAKAYSGVSLDSFVKKITFQQLSETGINSIGPSVEVMAVAEGLGAHKNAVAIRLNEIK